MILVEIDSEKRKLAVFKSTQLLKTVIQSQLAGVRSTGFAACGGPL